MDLSWSWNIIGKIACVCLQVTPIRIQGIPIVIAINSPRHLGKLNLSTLLLSNALRAGLEVQAVSTRNSGINSQLSGYTISNLTVSTDHLLPNLDISLTARNLFDKRYRNIAPDYSAPITSIEQDGRNFWLQLAYGFK